MDLRFSVQESKALSPIESPLFTPHSHAQSQTSFPITAVAVIGILATTFLLVSYYIFVIKCCLNWHRIDLLRRFSASRARRGENPPAVYSPAAALERLGLDEAAIRSIPTLKFKKENIAELDRKSQQQKSMECAVCLNEFQEEERLRLIPNCRHFFHIDCIDVWLQTNANCPLCRTSVTANYSLGDARSCSSPSSARAAEDYVVIEIGGSSPPSSSGEFITISPSKEKSKPGISGKMAKNLSRFPSMGDEFIDVNRGKDMMIQQKPVIIRRSFSMDSAADSQLYRAVEDVIMRQKLDKMVNISEVVGDGCSSSSNGNGNRMKRSSMFSFGQGRSWSRSAVQPLESEP